MYTPTATFFWALPQPQKCILGDICACWQCLFVSFSVEDISIVFIALECFWKHCWSVFMTAGDISCYFFKQKWCTNLQVIPNFTAEGQSIVHGYSWLMLVYVTTVTWCTVKQTTSEQSPTVLMPQALFLFQRTDVLFTTATAEANLSI